MTEKKRALGSNLSKLDAHAIQPEEYEEIPEWTEEMFAKAELRVGGDLVVRRKPGRPRSATPKKLIAIRLDPDVIEGFRAGGAGWQSRINAALRTHLTGKRQVGAAEKRRQKAGERS
jgi:uncharacterized protein (DUF4415 family)